MTDTVQTIESIPLSKLVPSSANVRRTDPLSRVDELAASIATHGLLQNLTVRAATTKSSKRGKAKASGNYEVIAGGRRLAALALLAKQKLIDKDAAIPCHVVTEGISEEISLAENALQCPMHPADQFEAFSKLHNEHGMGAEDIAARFGVTAHVVRQRLALGAVSPTLIAIYRDGDMNLDQLTAFAVTDDHALQERVWFDLGYDDTRQAILHRLGEDKVAADDRRAVFVGAEAYEAAGGTVIRDLFDEESGGFFADADVLNRMAREKLELEAAIVAAEGWQWVDVKLEYSYDLTADMRRVYPVQRDLTAEQAERLAELEGEYDELAEAIGDDEADDGASAALQRIEDEIAALHGPATYRPDHLERAGAFVCIGSDGGLRIERGFIRPEDMPKSDGGDDDAPSAKRKSADGLAPLSDKLIADLTSHRTAALRNELAQQPATAFASVVHALAGSIFYRVNVEPSCLRIEARLPSVNTHAPAIAESRAEQEIAARHEAWAARMPEDETRLWDMIVVLSEAEQMQLLAHCASLTVDAIRPPGYRRPTEREAHANKLALAVGLDMAGYWTPTVAGYLERVAKERILEAVREGVSPEAAQNMAGMKKQAMADAAAQRLIGKGWLPEVLRKPVAAAVGAVDEPVAGEPGEDAFDEDEAA